MDILPWRDEEEVQVHEPEDDDGKIEQADIGAVLHRLAMRLQSQGGEQRDALQEIQGVPRRDLRIPRPPVNLVVRPDELPHGPKREADGHQHPELAHLWGTAAHVRPRSHHQEHADRALHCIAEDGKLEAPTEHQCPGGVHRHHCGCEQPRTLNLLAHRWLLLFYSLTMYESYG